MKWKRILLYVLVAVFTAGLSFLCFDLGRRAGRSEVADPSVMAGRFEKGKASFCDLDENARMYVCPVMRKAVRLPGGAGVVYVCDPQGTTGFVSFVGTVPDEVKAQVVGKLLEGGLSAAPHCAKGSEEIVAVKKGQWKTATR